MEEEPTGTAETGKSTSSSLSQMTSKWLGLSLPDCFSEFIRHLRAFIFSASTMSKWNRSGALIVPSVLGPGGVGAVSSGSEGGPVCILRLHPHGLGIFESLGYELN